jgi:hypothetical protein
VTWHKCFLLEKNCSSCSNSKHVRTSCEATEPPRHLHVNAKCGSLWRPH